VALIDLVVQLLKLIVQVVAFATRTPLRRPKMGDLTPAPPIRKANGTRQPLAWSNREQAKRSRND
jgi:hypothetical protein